jgi:hypothetical protein
MGAHQLAEPAMSRLVQAWWWPAGMGLRGNGPGHTMLAPHFLDKRETDPEQVCQDTLRAEPAFIGMEDLLT